MKGNDVGVLVLRYASCMERIDLFLLNLIGFF